MVVLASASSVSLGHDIQLTFDMPVLLAAVYLFGPAVGGLMALVGSFDAREVRGRISLANALFNHAQVSLSVMLAGVLFIVAGGNETAWPLLVLPALAGLMGDVVANTLLAVIGGALKLRMSWMHVLRDLKFGHPGQFVLTYLGFGLLAVVLVSAYRDAGQWALAEFIVPLLLARQVFSHGTKLDAQTVAAQRAQRALTGVSTTIAEGKEGRASPHCGGAPRRRSAGPVQRNPSCGGDPRGIEVWPPPRPGGRHSEASTSQPTSSISAPRSDQKSAAERVGGWRSRLHTSLAGR